MIWGGKVPKGSGFDSHEEEEPLDGMTSDDDLGVAALRDATAEEGNGVFSVGNRPDCCHRYR